MPVEGSTADRVSQAENWIASPPPHECRRLERIGQRIARCRRLIPAVRLSRYQTLARWRRSLESRSTESIPQEMRSDAECRREESHLVAGGLLRVRYDQYHPAAHLGCRSGSNAFLWTDSDSSQIGLGSYDVRLLLLYRLVVETDSSAQSQISRTISRRRFRQIGSSV